MSKIGRFGVISAILSLLLGLTLAVFPAQGSAMAIASTDNVSMMALSSAKAYVKSTSDPDIVFGEAVFTELTEGLEIAVILNNAPPGTHAFHIHTVGSCDENGKAAKGHFNPADVQHGYLPEDGFDESHAGDLGNIEISDDGVGLLDLVIPGLTIESGEYAIAQRSVILHAQPDDFGQPTGNAGDRLGCGVINVTAS
ncbi:MAG: superoxide dismutase family protein [Jaaginema sp. PMC 1078.18]|nr:superoxide dismutase family protein [Jaaginema sp. PMC 1078.18]